MVSDRWGTHPAVSWREHAMADDGRRDRLVVAVWVVAMVLGVVACVFFVVQANGCVDALRQEVASNGEMISKLERDLESAEARAKENEGVDESASLGSASKAGEEVARLQNGFRGASSDDVGRMAGDLVKRFDDASKYEAVRWYVGDVDNTWRFCSIFDFTGSEFDCVWECRGNADGELYAYARATYDTKSDTFRNVAHHMTSKGAEFMAGEGGAVRRDVPGTVSVNDIGTSSPKVEDGGKVA